MKKKSKLFDSCLIAVVLLLTSSTLPATAYPWVYNLYGANELPDGASYGTVSLSYIYDGGRRGVRMTVTANRSILSPCSNFGIQRFGFNTTLAQRPPACPAGDADGDGVDDCADNCPGQPNGPKGGTCIKGTIGSACTSSSDCGADGLCSKAQEDTSPPGGNGCGDACECEGNFNGDADVDALDAANFNKNFGRSSFKNPCTDYFPCDGDFNCDKDVDSADAAQFVQDYGRNFLARRCPSAGLNLIITLPPGWTGSFKRAQYSEFGWFDIDIRGKGSSRANPLVIDIYHPAQSLSYTDFVVPNEKGQFFSLHIADFSYRGSECMSGFFASPVGDPGTTTTSSVKPTSTTTCKPTSTTTSKPSTSTTIKPSTTSTVPVITTSVPTTTTVVPVTTSTTSTEVPVTTTSVPTTTSSIPSSTTSVPTTSTSQPTTTSSQSTTTTAVILCTGEIYKGGICELGVPIDDPAYNRPGRRGLALTCEDIVDFCICTDCVNLGPECLVWTIDPSDPYLGISKTSLCSARLTVGKSCDQLEDIRGYTVTVTDTCNGWTDSVVVELGKVTLDVADISVQQGTDSITVPIKLVNRYNTAKALSADICACNGSDDKMVCIGCTVDPVRALDFSCAVAERDDGCCSVILYTTNPSALIFQGTGPVLNVMYAATEDFEGCSCLRPDNRQVSDQFNESVCACQSSGDICFKSCGDIHPPDCLEPGCAPCGDNEVNLFDVLEAVDIILGYQTPTACQLEHGDVPNGTPPYCGNPPGTPNCGADGDIDILDVLVIIDMVQGRANCCDYCLFRRIF